MTAPAAPATRSRAARWSSAGPTAAALAALVVLVLLNAFFTPNFATAGNFWNILWQVSTVVLVAVGMTLVIATGGIDLSVGSIMAIAGAVAATQLDNGVIVAGLLAMAAAIAVGSLNGALIARDRIGPVPIPVIVAVVVVAIAAFALRSTPWGRYVLAVGGNPAAARLAGVPVRRTMISVYAISGFLAGLAGLLEASRLGASDAAKIGLNVELDAIAATVVGGTALTGGRATIVGTVIGALVMQVIATSFNMLLIPYAWSLVLKAAIIVVAVWFQRPKRV